MGLKIRGLRSAENYYGSQYPYLATVLDEDPGGV
jgi:hypothetical protein